MPPEHQVGSSNLSGRTILPPQKIHCPPDVPGSILQSCAVCSARNGELVSFETPMHLPHDSRRWVRLKESMLLRLKVVLGWIFGPLLVVVIVIAVRFFERRLRLDIRGDPAWRSH